MGTSNASIPSVVRRSDLGLTISGTRITLYTILDYLHEDWPPHLIQTWLGLTEAQLQTALEYITAHPTEVETEYREVLRQAEENRRYWEERNRERLERIAAIPPRPGQEVLRAKLIEQRAKLADEQTAASHS